MLKNYITVLALFVGFCCPGQTVDEKGRKQGYWKKKDEKTNKLIYEGAFKDDQPVGKFIYYYPSDSIRAIVFFRNGSAASYAKLFHANTGKRMAEGKYASKEIKDSVWTYYDESGVLLSRERYAQGKKEGVSYVYLPDGSVSEEKSFRDGLEDGPHKQFFEGKRIKSSTLYKGGKMEGRSVYYFPNGIEAAAGYYREGKKNGAWIYRNGQGQVTEKELFKNGELASREETRKFFEKNKVSDAAPAPAKSQQKNAKKSPATQPAAGAKPAPSKN
jgi:antitoxin component YwqK of YwqJK toxin-antitoxin module